jgi:protoporphyrinogen oxidase
MTARNLILGAGVAGLGAAHWARGQGLPATVYEAAARAGGLLDNFTVDGFRFDTAVHLSFATEPEVARGVRPHALTSPTRRTRCAGTTATGSSTRCRTTCTRFRRAEKVELIAGLAASPQGEIRNYRDWLVQQYGEPIAARWPLVYTEKYWTVPAERLGTAWVGPRMRRADLREVLHGALSPETPNQYYIKEMRYPPGAATAPSSSR